MIRSFVHQVAFILSGDKTNESNPDLEMLELATNGRNAQVEQIAIGNTADSKWGELAMSSANVPNSRQTPAKIWPRFLEHY